MIDASIPLGIKPVQIESPVNQLAKVLQIQNVQQENQLSRLKMDELQRGNEEMNSLRRVLGQTGFSWDDPTHRNSAFAAAPLKAQSLYEAHTKGAKDRVETDEKTFKLAKERYDAYQREAGALFNDPTVTKDKVLGRVQFLAESGVLPANLAQNLAGRLPDDPEALRATLLQAVKTQLTPEQMLTAFAAKPTEVDNGQQKVFRDTNPNSPTYGQQTAGGVVQKVATPGEVMTDARTRSEGAANRSVTMRGQDMTDQRQRDANTIQQGNKTQQAVIELRKEFNGLPEVKNYREVLPIIQSVQRAPDTPAGDIDLIYGVGKVMDPNSVVREGEMNLVIKSGSPAQQLMGYYNYVKGGGRLGPAQRAQLMQVMESRVSGLKTNYDAARTTYQTAADKQGLPKDQVFIENPMPATSPTGLPPMSAIDAELARRQGKK